MTLLVENISKTVEWSIEVFVSTALLTCIFLELIHALQKNLTNIWPTRVPQLTKHILMVIFLQ